MKKLARILPLFLVVTMLLSLSAGAVYDSMDWKTLNEASTFEEPYVDYESVFDKTQELYLFDEYEKDLFALRDQYPDLMRLEIAGYSELGRPLNLISLISVDSQSASKTQPGDKKTPQVFGEKRPF